MNRTTKTTTDDIYFPLKVSERGGLPSSFLRAEGKQHPQSYRRVTMAMLFLGGGLSCGSQIKLYMAHLTVKAHPFHIFPSVHLETHNMSVSLTPPPPHPPLTLQGTGTSYFSTFQHLDSQAKIVSRQ